MHIQYSAVWTAQMEKERQSTALKWCWAFSTDGASSVTYFKHKLPARIFTAQPQCLVLRSYTIQMTFSSQEDGTGRTDMAVSCDWFICCNWSFLSLPTRFWVYFVQELVLLRICFFSTELSTPDANACLLFLLPRPNFFCDPNIRWLLRDIEVISSRFILRPNGQKHEIRGCALHIPLNFLNQLSTLTNPQIKNRLWDFEWKWCIVTLT